MQLTSRGSDDSFSTALAGENLGINNVNKIIRLVSFSNASGHRFWCIWGSSIADDVSNLIPKCTRTRRNDRQYRVKVGRNAILEPRRQ